MKLVDYCIVDYFYDRGDRRVGFQSGFNVAKDLETRYIFYGTHHRGLCGFRCHISGCSDVVWGSVDVCGTLPISSCISTAV
jgi:hypothetical protein